MLGISSVGKTKIATVIENMFDRMALQLLGEIPKLKNKKLIMIASRNEYSLAHLFVAAMKNKPLNEVERDVLKGVLDSAYGYIDSLKSRTQSNVTEQIDALIKESKAKNSGVTMEQVQKVLSVEMEKAKSHLRTITESEGTKARNMGVAMNISRAAADLNDNDPTVFFVVVRDGATCLAEDELVQTSRGPKAVGELKVGDILFSPSKQSQRGGNKVLSVEVQKKETIELDFGDRKVVCTKDHPILVRFGKTTCFMEADRITEDHDVIIYQNVVSKGDQKMIRRATTPRKFMVDLGYHDAWDFWRENIDDMLEMARTQKNRVGILKKYGIPICMWDQYVKHILKGYDPSLKFIGRSPKNNFNAAYIGRRSRGVEQKYAALGGDAWFVEQYRAGLNTMEISQNFGLPTTFVRAKCRSLVSLSFLRARGGRAMWLKHRKRNIKRLVKRGTPHFRSISKPEIQVYEFLKKSYLEMESSFLISNMKVDMCLPKEKVVIEYDGSGHTLRDKLIGNKENKITKRIDFCRDKLLKSLGYRVLRIDCPKDMFSLDEIKGAVDTFVNSKRTYEKWQG